VIEADQWSSVIGIDWQGWTDQFVSLQWFQTYIGTNSDDLVRKRRENTLTFCGNLAFLTKLSAQNGCRSIRLIIATGFADPD
jgi:hypothetical protein